MNKLLDNAAKNSKKWQEQIKKKALSTPESRAIYERVKQEIDLTLSLREAREKSNLSQEVIAERMDTTRTVVSRLESKNSSQRHSPSLQTLLKYANALGYTLKINLIPLRKNARKSVSK